MQRIVLAYSGGLATSIAIPWLADRYGAEIIAVTMDLGQGKEFLQEVRDRALATGALRAHVVDVRDEFARDYLVRALKAGLVGPDRSPVAAALARPLFASTLVAIADIEQARAVAHGDRNDVGRAFPASARLESSSELRGLAEAPEARRRQGRHRRGAPERGALRMSEMVNDLQAAVAAHYPEIARLVRALRKAGACHAAITGSGSTVFGLFGSQTAAATAARALASRSRRTLVTRTLNRPQYQRLAAI